VSEQLVDAVTRSEAQLADAGVATPRVDALLLIAHVLGLSRGELEARLLIGGSITASERTEIDRLVTRRANREPLQHILGTAAFRYLELEVGPGVFVPRPETELLTQVALNALDAFLRDRSTGAEPIRVVDLCTGSGAVALSIASERPATQVWGIELSDEAFAWAQRNIARLDLPNARIERGDAADALPELNGTVAIVVSNPPYVPDAAVPRDPEVRLFDPALALYGGPDGLSVIRQVSATAHRLLVPGGSVAIEHGELQGAEVASILSADGFHSVRTLPDLSGRDRITTGRR